MRKQPQRVLLAGCVIVLSTVLLGLAGCGSDGDSSFEAENPSEPEPVSSLETNDILSDPLAEEVLQTMFAPEKDLSANGAVGPNQQGYVNIRPQGEGSYLAVALGFARNDEELIERGLRALEFGLPHQDSSGAFERSSAQDIARFGLFGLRSYNLLANSTYAQHYPDRLNTVSKALLRTEEHLLTLLSRHPEIYEATNQVAMLAYMFTVGGQTFDNKALMAKGDELLQWVITTQRENGVFPELGGHDSHYQAISMMALANMYMYSEKTAHQETVYPALLAGFEWEEARVSSSGRLDDEGNTRTANDPEYSPEGKQIDPRELALTFLYLSHLGPEFSDAHDLGELVLQHFLTNR